MTPHDEAETRKILKQVRRELARAMGPVDRLDTDIGTIIPLLRRVVLGEAEAVIEEVGRERFHDVLVAGCAFAVAKYAEQELRRLEDRVLERLGEVDVEDDEE